MFLKFFFAFSLVCVAIVITNNYKIENLKIGDNHQSEHVDTVTENDSNHNNNKLNFATGSFYLPKKIKARPRPLGEDAHFICKARNVVGVADGVGLRGVDAGIYARELMKNAETAALNQNKGSINPKTVLQSAYKKTRSRGTSTACIIALNDNNVLRYANLGDSGFVLFRGNKFLYRSPVQQHEFNWPYQLGSTSRDTPDSAYEEEIHIEDGDIVVAGTDGLFDNVYEYEIEEILNRNNDLDPKKLAREIGELALRHSLDQHYFSPFAKLAAQEEGFEYEGGKYDDITVVVAKIENNF